jgi:hypothetical protein
LNNQVQQQHRSSVAPILANNPSDADVDDLNDLHDLKPTATANSDSPKISSLPSTNVEAATAESTTTTTPNNDGPIISELSQLQKSPSDASPEIITDATDISNHHQINASATITMITSPDSAYATDHESQQPKHSLLQHHEIPAESANTIQIATE